MKNKKAKPKYFYGKKFGVLKHIICFTITETMRLLCFQIIAYF